MRQKLLILTIVLMWLGANAQTSTFSYTASQKIEVFNELSNFVGADSVISHDYDEATGTGNVVYAGQVTEMGGFQWNRDITAIVIPEGVTTISYRAFYYCSNLSAVTLPKSLIRVKNMAFQGCNALKDKPFVIDDIAWWCSITFEAFSSNPLYYAQHIYSDENTEITHLVVPEGVTGIGSYAFGYCVGITSVSLPESLTAISNSAFYQCTGLQAAVIPAGVTEIGDVAFNNCSKLERVTISEGVTKIGQSAFAHTGLRELTLPSTIRSLSQSFYGCDSLVSLTLTEGITMLGNSFYSCHALTEVHIPSTVKQMQYNDFNDCSNLERVTIAEGVEKVSGFGGCSKLSSITIPSTATSITSFSQCSSLQSIYVPKGVTEFSGFNGCTGLQKIIIEDLATWCNILFSSYATSNAQYYAKHLFLGTPENHSEITDLVIPDGVTQLKRYAFNNMEGITAVTLPSSITSIDNSAFSDCTAVTDVFSLCDPVALTWGGGGFKAEKATLMHVADTAIWKSRFPAANVTFVGDLSMVAYSATARVDAFDNVAGFTGASRVVAHVFNTETGEGTVTYCGPVTGLADEALAGQTALTAVVLPEGLMTIGSRAFNGCTALGAVTLPTSVTAFESGAFLGVPALAEVFCSADPAAMAWEDNDNSQAFLPGKATRFNVTEAQPWTERFPNANVTFVDGMTRFNYTATAKVTAFHNIQNFTGAISLAAHTFDEASGCGAVTYNGVVTAIKHNAFSNEALLTGITIPLSVTAIGGNAFDKCANLVEVCLPDSLETVEGYVFYNCESLTTVNIPSKLTRLGNNMFSRCHSLADIDIPENIVDIDYNAFYECTALQSVLIPASVTHIGSNAFNKCTGLEMVITPSLEAWCNINFDYLANPLDNAHRLFVGDKVNNEEVVGRLVIPAGVAELKTRVFQGLTTITSVDFPEGLTTIGSEAFIGCTGLAELVLPEGFTTIKYHALYDCTALKRVDLPSTLVSIESWTFDNTPNIDDVYCAADINRLYFGDSSNNNAFKPGKCTLFHVDDKAPWIERYPNANVTFVDETTPHGDLNGDGSVNTGDVSALYNALLQGSSIPIYDLNGDGSVNTGDVSALYQIILAH